MFFDLQQGKSILKNRKKKNKMYEGFENNAGGNDLDKDLNVENKSNADNDTELVNQLNALEDVFNVKKAEYAATYKTLMDKTQTYMTSADYKNTAINNNVYVNHVMDTTSMVPTRVGCYKSDTTNTMIPQLDLGSNITSDICKTRAADLGYSVYALSVGTDANSSTICLVGDDVNAATANGYAYRTMSPYKFVANATANTGAFLMNGQVGIYKDSATNGVTLDTNTPGDARCATDIGGLINTTGTIATWGSNCPPNPIPLKLPKYFSITHPDGRVWKYDIANDRIRLNTGTPIELSTYDDPSVYNNNINYVGLRDSLTGTFIRHAGFNLHSNSFVANNYDFAWLFKYNQDDTFKVFNAYGGGYYIGYDADTDSVLIVPPNDPTIINWVAEVRNNDSDPTGFINSYGEVYPVQAIKTLDNGENVYMTQNGNNVYMVSAVSETSKTYQGKLDDFIPSNWNSYTSMPAGFFEFIAGIFKDDATSRTMTLVGNSATSMNTTDQTKPLDGSWQYVASENNWYTIPVGRIYRYGAGNGFFYYKQGYNGSQLAKNQYMGGDPAYGATKQIDIFIPSTPYDFLKNLAISSNSSYYALQDKGDGTMDFYTSTDGDLSNISKLGVSTDYVTNSAGTLYGNQLTNVVYQIGKIVPLAYTKIPANPIPSMIGNWTTYIVNKILGRNVASYIIGSEGADPSVGCAKQFSVNYKCGLGASKTIDIDAEAAGKTLQFDCASETTLCAGYRLTLGDDGKVSINDLYGNFIWATTAVNDPAALVIESNKAVNTKYGRNYLNAGDTLALNEFIGSPSGNYYLIMIVDETTNNAGLQVRYTIYNCNDINTKDRVGNDKNTNFIYQINKASRDYLGKVGFINNDGALQEYSSDMIQPNTDYDFIGNYDSVGYDLSQYTAQNISTNDCNTKCSEDDNCAGYVFNQSENTCYLKNASMFPYGLRKPDSNSALYTRSKKVSNDVSCPKAINNTISADEWSKMPVGEKMQLTTLCKLGLVTSADQADLDQKSNAVTNAATNLQNKIDDLVKNDMNLVKKLGNHVNKLQKDLKQYTSINKKIGKNENTIEGLSGFSTDTELNMISNNYRYLLFTILAIFLVGTIIKLSKK